LQYKQIQNIFLKQEPKNQPMPLEFRTYLAVHPIALATSFTSAPVFHKALT
jgi:hypothetical protein